MNLRIDLECDRLYLDRRVGHWCDRSLARNLDYWWGEIKLKCVIRVQCLTHFHIIRCARVRGWCAWGFAPSLQPFRSWIFGRVPDGRRGDFQGCSDDYRILRRRIVGICRLDGS